MSESTQNATPLTLTIDHVTVAGPALTPMQEAFASVGLSTDYGGPHSNNITHMALLGFVDGSYIELISAVEEASQADHAFWGEHIAGKGGPCAWAVRVDDVAAEAERVSNLGIPVQGPAYYSRRRPDHAVVEWDLAFLGEEGAGATLPFIIKDITPREIRVRPSPSVADGLLTGVDSVILGVDSLEPTIDLFQHTYNWSAPTIQDDPQFGAQLADFKEGPVVLAAPLAGHAWLADRLARFGPSPCAYLIGTRDFQAARDRFPLLQSRQWFDRQIGWFDPARLDGVRLGVVLR